MPRDPLPESLGPIFSVGRARAAGVPPSRLRASDLISPCRGVRIAKSAALAGVDFAAGTTEGVVRARAVAIGPTLPASQFFSHLTAAVLWDLPVPASLLVDHGRGPRDLDIGVFAPLRHPRHVGVKGHQVRPDGVQVVSHPVLGVRVASPASTWALLGSQVRDPYELVALGDALVREQMFANDRAPLATLADLRQAMDATRRVGGPALRRAFERIRPRSASRMETRSRLILIDAGLPEPELNHLIRDRTGAVVACVDLAYPERRVAMEYEGEHHLTDPRQWSRDIRRYEALAAMGWFVVRITKTDVFGGRAEFVRRVRRALAG